MPEEVKKTRKMYSRVSYSTRGQDVEAITPGEGVDVDDIVSDYKDHMQVAEIYRKYGISSGQLTSHLSARGVTRREIKKRQSTLFSKLAKFTNKDIDNILEDYKLGVVPIKDIYEKYGIHKNGLYYLLDTHGVERRGLQKRKED